VRDPKKLLPRRREGSARDDHERAERKILEEKGKKALVMGRKGKKKGGTIQPAQGRGGGLNCMNSMSCKKSLHRHRERVKFFSYFMVGEKRGREESCFSGRGNSKRAIVEGKKSCGRKEKKVYEFRCKLGNKLLARKGGEEGAFLWREGEEKEKGREASFLPKEGLLPFLVEEEKAPLRGGGKGGAFRTMGKKLKTSQYEKGKKGGQRHSFGKKGRRAAEKLNRPREKKKNKTRLQESRHPHNTKKKRG